MGGVASPGTYQDKVHVHRWAMGFYNRIRGRVETTRRQLLPATLSDTASEEIQHYVMLCSAGSASTIPLQTKHESDKRICLFFDMANKIAHKKYCILARLSMLWIGFWCMDTEVTCPGCSQHVTKSCGSCTSLHACIQTLRIKEWSSEPPKPFPPGSDPDIICV